MHDLVWLSLPEEELGHLGVVQLIDVTGYSVKHLASCLPQLFALHLNSRSCTLELFLT